MHEKDALAAHLRDELGQHPHTKARPVQAAVASAAAFTSGGLIPFIGAFAPTTGTVALSIVAFTVVGLIFTGIVSAKTAGSKFSPQLCESFLVVASEWQLPRESDNFSM